MTVVQRSVTAVAALAAVVLISGFGQSSDADTTRSAQVGVGEAPGLTAPPASGLSAGGGLDQVISQIPTPGTPDPSLALEALRHIDKLGAPRDIFEVVGGTAVDDPSTPETGIPSTPVTPSTPSSPTDPTTIPSTPTLPSTPTVPTTPTSPAPTSPAAPGNGAALQADFDIAGEPILARVGDAIPPDSQQFTVKQITAKTVVLTLNTGLLPDGKDSLTVKLGQSITLRNTSTDQGYSIRLVKISAAKA